MKPRSWGRGGGSPSDVPLHPWSTVRPEVAAAWQVLGARNTVEVAPLSLGSKSGDSWQHTGVGWEEKALTNAAENL